jgi:hypothetical protein
MLPASGWPRSPAWPRPALAHQPLLDRRHVLHRQFHAQIAARHHDPVGGREDLVEGLDRGGFLDLRQDRGAALGQRARLDPRRRRAARRTAPASRRPAGRRIPDPCGPCRSAASGSTTSGTFTPLRFEIVPPAITVQSAKSGPQASTRRRILPSLTSSARRAPAPRRSPCAAGCTRVRRPASSRSKRKAAPSSQIVLAVGERCRTRSFGPCRSARMAIGRPECPFRPADDAAWRARISSWLPWLMFRRNTSAPASKSADHVVGSRPGPAWRRS